MKRAFICCVYDIARSVDFWGWHDKDRVLTISHICCLCLSTQCWSGERSLSLLALSSAPILKITSHLRTYRKAQGPCFGNRAKVQRTRAVQFSLESGFGGFYVQGLKRKMFLFWNATYILYGFLNVSNLCFWVPFLPGDTNSVCLNALCMVTLFLIRASHLHLGR